MAMTDDVYRILIAVILLVVGLGIFNAIFAQPDLDGMAQESATALGEAISAAANLPAVDSEPALNQTDYYAVAPIRLGQPMNAFSGWTAAWSDKEPRYEIFYEKFPDDQPLGFVTTWTESYPWSGGMGSQLVFYGFMRFGLGTKIGRKILTAPIWLPITGIYKGYKFFDMLPARLYHAMEAGESAFSQRRLATFLDNHSWWTTRAKNYVARVEAKQGQRWANVLDFHVASTLVDEAIDSGTLDEKFARDFVQTMFGTTIEQADNAGRLGFDFSQMPRSDIGKFKFIRDSFPKKTIRQTFGEFFSDSDYMSRTFTQQFDDLFEVPPTDSFRWPRFKKWWKNNVNYRASHWRQRRGLYRWQSEAIASLKAGKEMAVTFSDDTGQIFQVSRKEFMKFSPEDKIRFSRALGETFDDEAMAIRHFDSLINAQKYKDAVLFIPEGTSFYDYNRLSRRLKQADALENLNNKKLFSQLEHGGKLKTDILEWCTSRGIKYNACGSLWDNSIIKKYGNGGMTGVTESLYGRAFRETAQDDDEIKILTNMFSGTYEPRPSVAFAKQAGGVVSQVFGGRARTARIIMFDFGKYKNPFWHGAFTTQLAQEEQTANMEDPSKNALILMQGAEATAIPLDEEVDGYQVKLYRPKPSLGEVTPIHVGTAMFYGSIVNNPRYYTVSPCFGIAKVWKQSSDTGKGTLFVKIDPLCDIDDSETGSTDEDATCANYCYATNDRIWGKANRYSPFTEGIASYVGLYAGCVAASLGTGTLSCNQGAALGAGGVVAVEVAAHAATDSCTDDNYWGYWNYYLAADTFDWLETLGTWGAGGAAAATKEVAEEGAEQAVKQGTKLTAKGFIKQNIGKLATDASLGPQLAGDMVLAWTNVGYDKHGIEYEDILNNQAECVWERK